MRCEMHCSDTDIFINSLKRVADEVRIVQEEKSRWFICSILRITPEDINFQLCQLCILFYFLSYSSLVSKEDFWPRQMQSSDNKIWPWSGPGPSCKWTDAVFKAGQYLRSGFYNPGSACALFRSTVTPVIWMIVLFRDSAIQNTENEEN